jgi:hypothetical protein
MEVCGSGQLKARHSVEGCGKDQSYYYSCVPRLIIRSKEKSLNVKKAHADVILTLITTVQVMPDTACRPDTAWKIKGKQICALGEDVFRAPFFYLKGQ